MGKGASKHVENKQVDSTGAVNNNVVITGVTDTVEVENEVLITIAYLLYVIVALKVIELLYYAFREYKKSLKKRYINNPS